MNKIPEVVDEHMIRDALEPVSLPPDLRDRVLLGAVRAQHRQRVVQRTTAIAAAVLLVLGIWGLALSNPPADPGRMADEQAPATAPVDESTPTLNSPANNIAEQAADKAGKVMKASAGDSPMMRAIEEWRERQEEQLDDNF